MRIQLFQRMDQFFTDWRSWLARRHQAEESDGKHSKHVWNLNDAWQSVVSVAQSDWKGNCVEAQFYSTDCIKNAQCCNTVQVHDPLSVCGCHYWAMKGNSDYCLFVLWFSPAWNVVLGCIIILNIFSLFSSFFCLIGKMEHMHVASGIGLSDSVNDIHGPPVPPSVEWNEMS